MTDPSATTDPAITAGTARPPGTGDSDPAVLPLPTTLAIGRLRNLDFNGQIQAYLRAIDATLEPFGGRYLLHGSVPTVLEGTWAEDLVILAFPDRAAAMAWYQSPAYQAILRLRTDNCDSDVVLVDTVDPAHRATDLLAKPG